MKERYEIDSDSMPNLEKIYAFVLLYQELFEEYRLDAVASECWTSMQLGVGAMPCTSFSILADMGYIIACETDMHAAITMAMLSCASLGESRPFWENLRCAILGIRIRNCYGTAGRLPIP